MPLQVAENRAARLEAANRHEEAMRAAAAAKVKAVEDRLVCAWERRDGGCALGPWGY